MIYGYYACKILKDESTKTLLLMIADCKQQSVYPLYSLIYLHAHINTDISINIYIKLLIVHIIHINIYFMLSTVPGTSKATVEMEKVSWFFIVKFLYQFGRITINFILRLVTELPNELN